MTIHDTAGARMAFVWRSFSRFVEVAPVARGWLVLWGRYQDLGRRRELTGNRTYLDLGGVRRRVADSVFELTHDPALVSEALVRFDRTSFPPHHPSESPEPL
jgi:predicted methyltransferase MtxX (methanogen marker protein 4)